MAPKKPPGKLPPVYPVVLAKAKARAPLAQIRNAPPPHKLLEQNKARVNRLVDATSKEHARKLLKRAEAELVRRLHQAGGLEGGGLETFTNARARIVLTQVRTMLKELTLGMKKSLVDSVDPIVGQQVEGVIQYMNAAEKKYRGMVRALPIDETRMFDRVAMGTESSLLHRISTDPEHPGHPGVLARYEDATIGKFEEILQGHVLTGRSWSETRDMIVDASPFLQGAPAYWGERLLRTESIAMYNRAGWESNRQLDAALGDMCKVLVMVDDDRTAADSYAVTGQIRRSEEAFETWYGLMQHPPARSNDRESVLPQRISWPLLPEMRQRTDDEVAARWAWEGRKGAPPPRPLMTTVPLSAFGK